MTAVPENQMLEVWGEEKDSPKSDWQKLGRRQMEKSRGGQGKGSLEPWRKESSTLVCTLGTDVASEISITIHYVTAKGWEQYLVYVISLNSRNLKKDHWGENRSMKLSAMPVSRRILSLVELGCEPKSKLALASWHCVVSGQVPFTSPQSSFCRVAETVVLAAACRMVGTVWRQWVDTMFSGNLSTYYI